MPDIAFLDMNIDSGTSRSSINTDGAAPLLHPKHASTMSASHIRVQSCPDSVGQFSVSQTSRDISLPRPTLHATQPIYPRAQETAAQESPGPIRPDHPERKLGTPEVQWPLGVRRHCATYGNQGRTTAATGSLFSISVSVSRSRHVSGPLSPIDADRKVRLDGTSFVESFRRRQTLKAFKAFKIPATTYNM
ncbi:hypothetical protein E5D57_002340 [Metarhizium anisopliae]|nr:hypothetical protein E5D57_002340 [Metarhizium anisopliae]